MGYYSQVGLSLKRKNFEELCRRMNTLEMSGTFIDFYDEEKIYTGCVTSEEVVVRIWNCLKWYPEFPEVKCVEDFLSELDEKNEDYQFVRIGEDLCDAEERGLYGGGACEKIYLCRSIEME